MIPNPSHAVVRLEPDERSGDLARALQVELADPLWLLGRQWQLGEHRGEDSSSPVQITFARQSTPITLQGGSTAGDVDLRTTPPEAVLTSEQDAWWTPGRRVRMGRHLAAHPQAAAQLPDGDEWQLPALPTPYEALQGRGYDGLALWRHRDRLALDDEWFVPAPPPAALDHWQADRFTYEGLLTAGQVTLHLDEHPGGRVEWYAVDADVPIGTTDADQLTTLASRVRYPGAPTPRWWQIEDAAVDIGGPAPDRGHLATLLVADLLASNSDDWFTFAIDARPGTVVTLRDVHVTDSFGEVWDLAPPADGWSLFQVRGLDVPRTPGSNDGPTSSVIVWPAVEHPVRGPLLDEVVVAVDEHAGRLWAGERRVAGRHVATPPMPSATPATADLRDDVPLGYHPGSGPSAHWHPYVFEGVPGDDGSVRRFVQGRAVDLSGAEAEWFPPPLVDLLADPGWGVDPAVTSPHTIDPGAVPRFGLRLVRRHVLGRRTDGRPALWVERRREPRSTTPTPQLRHDEVHERAVEVPD